MAKYSFEFKMKVVQDYLQGKGGSVNLTKKYGIGNGDNKHQGGIRYLRHLY